MQVRGPLLTRRRTRAGRASADEELEALRTVVVGPEQRRLDEIEKPSPTVIGGLLPEAVSHAQVARPDELATTLEKPVTSAVRRIARREPAFFGEVLAPVVGTAVRRAVADAIAALMRRINEIVETRMSVRSLRWRLEARRKGRPYAEIVLAHTLVYRVEWAVLIDTRTSLVLAQASSSDALQHASDQTAAMLAAINTFVSEAMQPASPGGVLNAIEVGDVALWIERDSTFTLAIALRGVAPPALRDELRATLEMVHALHGEPSSLLDASVFEDTQPLLLDLMKEELRRPPSRARALLVLLGCAVVAAIAYTILRGAGRDARDERYRTAYRDALASVPGLVVTSVESPSPRHRGYLVRGLRDPRAARPEPIVAALRLPPASFDLAPFESRDPRVPRAPSPMAAVDGAVRELEGIGIEFARGDASVMTHGAEIVRAEQLIARLRQAAARADVAICVEVLGDNDESGRERINRQLRTARASTVVHALEVAGVPAGVLVARAGDPLWTRPRGRRVTFRVDLRPDTMRGGCP